MKALDARSLKALPFSPKSAEEAGLGLVVSIQPCMWPAEHGRLQVTVGSLLPSSRSSSGPFGQREDPKHMFQLGPKFLQKTVPGNVREAVSFDRLLSSGICDLTVDYQHSSH